MAVVSRNKQDNQLLLECVVRLISSLVHIQVLCSGIDP